jgi:hypothetical protein
MRSSGRWLRLALLVPLLVLLMGQEKCPPPNRNAPDDTGPLPPGVAAATKKYEEKAPQNPPRLACDVPVYQTVNVSQQGVNCDAAAVNYAQLFTEAEGLARGIAAVTECPANCRPAQWWISRLVTDCQGGTAGVILEIGLLCPLNMARPAGVQIAANDPRLNGPPLALPNPQPPAQPSIGDVKGQVAGGPVTCNPVEVVEYRYREPAACGPNFPYGPYIDRAQARAALVCSAVQCAAGCQPCVPPINLRTQWGCRNGREVDVKVQVQCCKP